MNSRATRCAVFENLQAAAVRLALAVLLSQTLAACTHIKLSPRGGGGSGLGGSFASAVTRHLFDGNYKSYEASQKALSLEIAPGVLAQLKARGICAKSAADIKARARDLSRRKQTTAVEIGSAVQSDTDSHGFIPVEVQGTVTTQTGKGKTTSHFDTVYLLGMNVKTKKMVVASIQFK